MSAPLTVASAIAARTQRFLKIGTRCRSWLGHPLRLAEETATIDQISGGRLVFGVGRSAFPRAYDAYGISYEESQDRLAESLKIIRKAWTEPVCSHRGRYFSFDNFTLAVAAGVATASDIGDCRQPARYYPAIGALGYPLVLGRPRQPARRARGAKRAYREAYRAAGQSRPPAGLSAGADLCRPDPRAGPRPRSRPG